MTTQTIPQIDSQIRDQLGSRNTQRLRKTGRLPAVIYGHKLPPVHISLDQSQINDLLHHHAHLLQVAVDNKTEPCLIKQVQWDHLGSDIIHLDLARVDLTEQVTVTVDLELTGEAIGLKESGAFLQHQTAEIQVQCLATQIPEIIRVDISQLAVGDAITVADLSLPHGVTADEDPDTLIAAVHLTALDEEDETALGEPGAGEPEVIGKKDQPQENADSA